MSYTVLARRYRSTTFDEVVGQEHVAQTLKKAIETGRLAHAYLFCGTRGTGKTSTARILAKALNCERFDAPTATPCGACTSCTSIARGEDMDVIEIDAASNTGVDNVREIIENSQFRPARSRFKVYIIDEVHMLSKNAFNALLKTLEEPPEHVKFILATTEPEKVLPTILSRCQRYDFRNIPTREIAAHLKTICKTEEIDAHDDALLLVAKAGAGSMRDALSLLDRLLSIGERTLTVATIEQLLGMPRAQLLFDLAQAIGEGDVKATLTRADAMITSGLSADTLVAGLVDHLRNLLILRTCGPQSGLVEVPGLSMKDLTAQAERFDAVVLTQDLTILEELRRHMRQSQSGRALLDATLVRLALAEQFASIGDLIARVNGGAPAAGNGAGVQKKKHEVTAPAGGADVARTQVAAQFRSPPPPPTDPPPLAASGGEPPLADVEVAKPPAAQMTQSAVSSAPENPAPLASVPAIEIDDDDDDDDDDLPRPGKVWDGPSLKDLLKASSPPPSPRPAPTEPSVEALTDDDVQRLWPQVMAMVETQMAALSGVLSMARLTSIEDDVAVIRFRREAETFAKRLAANGKKEAIGQIFSSLRNVPTAVRFEVDPAPEPGVPTDASAATPAPAVASAPRFTPAPPRRTEIIAPPTPMPAPSRPSPEAMEEAQKDPLVQAILKEFGGLIIKVE